MNKKRHYNNGKADFLLEPISDSVVKVTYRDQTGYFGLKRDWEAARPYTWTTYDSDVHDDGIGGMAVYSLTTAEEALDYLCSALLSAQGKEDSKRINPEQRKSVARQVLREFLEELPD